MVKSPSTSHEFTVRILKRRWGAAPSGRVEMARYCRQRGPVLGLTINSPVQSLEPQENVRFASFLSEKVKIFFQFLGIVTHPFSFFTLLCLRLYRKIFDYLFIIIEYYFLF